MPRARSGPAVRKREAKSAVLTSKTGNLWLGPGDTARATSTPAPVLACPSPAASVRDLFHLGPHPVGAGKVHLLAALDSLCQQGGQQLVNRILYLRPGAFRFMAAFLCYMPESGPAEFGQNNWLGA